MRKWFCSVWYLDDRHNVRDCKECQFLIKQTTDEINQTGHVKGNPQKKLDIPSNL